jgi:predicted dehydrogenase
MNQPLRIGVVGLGMGIHHAMACLDRPEVELVAIAEPQVARLDRLYELSEKRLGTAALTQAKALTRYDDYQTMVREARLDAITLALPTAIHYEASLWCLRQGLHVLCEKPPTTTAAEMQEIVATAEERGLAFAYVRQQRFEPHKFAARELAVRGDLGTLSHAESHWLRSRNIPWRQGWGVNKSQGGGVLLDLGIHTIDDAWFVMGNPRPVSAYAVMHTDFQFLAEKRDDMRFPYDADDLTVGIIRFENGASLTTSMSFAGNRVSPQDVGTDGVVESSEWQELGVYGSQAGVDVQKKRLVEHHDAGVTVSDLSIPAHLADMPTGFSGLVADFAQAILEQRQPLNCAVQAWQLMQMLDALRESAETGVSVTIAEENMALC